MARSISFVVDDVVDTRITITELDDGSLRFDIESLDSEAIGDLRGFFADLLNFDVDDPLNGLSFEPAPDEEDLITNSRVGEGSVDTVDPDMNVKGEVANEHGRFDFGTQFGTAGIGDDDIQSASFILSGPETLTLDSLDLVDIALRYTSVGEEDGSREGSLKIAAQTSGVARNDAFTVQENSDGSVDLLINDTNGILADGTRKTVISVIDADGTFTDTGTGFQRVVVVDGLTLGTLVVSYDGVASFVANGADVDKLAHDDAPQLAFTYETRSIEGNLATADVLLTVDGLNDQPVASDLFFTTGEDNTSEAVGSDSDDPNDSLHAPFAPLTGTALTASFVASDIDLGDLLTYELISAPVDAFGNHYGMVTNNGDGTFTFDPLDDFQFLEAGESRDVTFQYQARDDSGIGESPAAPEETELSDAATITITVEGADDADISFAESLLFVSEDQSQFDTGDAIVIDISDLAPALEFVGFEWDESYNANIINKQTFSGQGLRSILNGIEDVANAIGDLACDAANFITLGLVDCDADIDLPDSISTPGVKVVGGTDGRIGLAPYFELNSGDVDSHIPVDVVFTAPRQVEAGETFTLESAYTIDDGATFMTQSPSLSFGLDLIFDVALNAAVQITSSTFGGAQSFNILPPIDINESLNLLDFNTASGAVTTGLLPGTSIFDFTAPIELPGGVGEVAFNFPDIAAEGTLDADPTAPDIATISGSGEDSLATLTADIDGIASLLPFVPPFEYDLSNSFSIDILGESVNLLGFDVGLELLDLDLINTLSVVQNFSLGIEELPMMLTFEDGSNMNGLFVGDDIMVNAPTDFDANTEGDMDGLIDFAVDIDMDAVFSNLSTLGFRTDIFAGLLSFTAAITSDFATDLPAFSLFSDKKNGSTTDDDFLISATETLFETDDFATLFENERFALEGFEENPGTMDMAYGFYDIA